MRPSRREHEIALEVMTEGKNARISERQKNLLFGPSPEQRMDALQARCWQWVWARSVQALAIGKKTRKGRVTGDLAIIVMVDKKRRRSKLRHPVPRRVRIPKLGWLLTDVEEIGQLEPQTFPDRVRPAMPGCSIGHEDMSTMGTFGLLVQKTPGNGSGTFVLSNTHVIALDGLAKSGDGVVQPGPDDADGPGNNDEIATLTEWIGFDFTTPGFPNMVDAAIARVTKSSSVARAFRIFTGAPKGVSDVIEEGMAVKKVGRSTDDTYGTVKHVNAKVKVRHMMNETTSVVIGFSNQVVCSCFTDPGDSGSAVLNEDDEVIGLHASGSISTSTFNGIDDVFSLLNLTLA